MMLEDGDMGDGSRDVLGRCRFGGGMRKGCGRPSGAGNARMVDGLDWTKQQISQPATAMS